MRRWTIYISICLVMILTACQSYIDNAVTDKKYTETIMQRIGGQLICNVRYTVDFHSWDYDIEYTYKDERDSTYKIGTGKYAGQEWPKDEQLLKFDRWTILKTSKDRDADKLIIGNTQANSWTEYEISPETIEQDEFWKKEKLNSSPDYFNSVAKIQAFELDGQFSVIYTFAKKDRIFSFMTGERKIDYVIDRQTGRPLMTKISEL
jgi:hypothetical protein